MSNLRNIPLSSFRQLHIGVKVALLSTPNRGHLKPRSLGVVYFLTGHHFHHPSEKNHAIFHNSKRRGFSEPRPRSIKCLLVYDVMARSSWFAGFMDHHLFITGVPEQLGGMNESVLRI
ncbi:hypothetical protein AVEN_163781-1 [Araneus ventricosus]|uniref:Uncharacterized protein n=1 Tax=Araneus ventricosus TaxID=182803 RepID=A0A4Y2KV73_ARAVE|nr:hypothetical protein AVEN_163781-1 [Araneus ventricosus]